MQFAMKEAPRQLRRDAREVGVLEREHLDEAIPIPLPHPIGLLPAMGALRVVGDEESGLRHR